MDYAQEPLDALTGGAPMTSELSAAARRLAIRNALICSAGTLAAWLAAFLGFLALGRSREESILFGLALVAGIVYLLNLRAWLRSRRSAGSLLLDCGPLPGRRSGLISAAWLFVSGVVMIVLDHFYDRSVDVFGWFFILQAIPTTLLAFRPFHFREHGLWSGMGLLAWDKIESYWWDGDWTLMLITRGSPWSFRKGAFLVRPELREAADRLLRARVSTPTGRVAA
jgi:hypothetical protein